MGNHDEADSSKESVLRFGLKINKVIKGKNVQFQAANQGWIFFLSATKR